jgi:putative oxidoreductase
MSLTSLEGLAERNRDGVLLLARILLAAIFVQSGFGKLSHFAAFADSMAAKGLPLPFL